MGELAVGRLGPGQHSGQRGEQIGLAERLFEPRQIGREAVRIRIARDDEDGQARPPARAISRASSTPVMPGIR